jgi:hypothetical protein
MTSTLTYPLPSPSFLERALSALLFAPEHAVSPCPVLREQAAAFYFDQKESAAWGC